MFEEINDAKIYCGDCFEEFKNIENKSINLFLLDLPYGQINQGWDTCIDLDKMWEEIKRTMKPNALIIFFCTTKFGHTLINSNPKWFKYDLVYHKAKAVGFLSSKKLPLRAHEMIYLFSYVNTDDIDRSRNLELRKYAEKVRHFINKPLREIQDKLGNMGVSHFYSYRGSQFGLPTLKTYNFLIQTYNIDKMEGFIPHDELKKKWMSADGGTNTYNVQKVKGKPYITKGKGEISTYGTKRIYGENKGDRHPTSVLKHCQPHKSVHPTQKPLSILEWLIKSYSNEGEVVCDFTMGSGSTGVAALNTKRKFIGIEKEPQYFNIAVERLKKI